MVFKKIKIKKSDLENPINILEPQEPKERCYGVALFAVFVAGFIVFFTLLSWAAVLEATAARLPRDCDAPAGPVLVCYYNTPRPGAARQLQPRDIHPRLCTHINVAFATIEDDEIHLEEHQRQTISELVKLKETNPNLKVLLSVGGAGSHSGFQNMVSNHTCRKTFIRSIKYILRNLTLDGVDLDWEFPAVEYQSEAGKRERQHFSQLLREIRAEYRRERRSYLLTVAAAAPQVIVDAAYDVEQLNLYVDLVNIMTYDFHTYTRFTPLTGLNSPLYARAAEELYLATLNINYTVQMYRSKGLDPGKMVVGIPTYGHSFTLVNSENTNVGSPALGFGKLGELGFVSYTDICRFLDTFGNESKIHVDEDARVPYFYRGSEWVSYDNPDSVMEKADYIRSNKLRGAMVYSLNADDYEGVCVVAGRGRFPLALSIKETLGVK
ncbi:chitinase-3-like protein 1 [Maniola hyperantus]|uniref:chitinase-3-like protein 1 n=1 Tax=Aphantopus hyperantus TaxID=2795564 RepID=UPI00156984E7|nr:chitinase-3-like protein 1 [Maniola hyperantus]